jgi:hypothetical protein
MKPRFALLLAATLALALTLGASGAHATGGAEWRFAPVKPPQLPGESNEQYERRTPIGLGKIGDIEFIRPNLGLLITAGNPPTVPPGVWAYDGVSWRPLTGDGGTSGTGVCGASDGRIAWALAGNNPAGEEEFDFWTVSDGRLGQVTEHGVPLADNTLCHFKGTLSKPGEVVGSYGSLAFLPSSYQAMHAAGCLSQSDCWFGGDPLPAGNLKPGSFHLHWDGTAISANPNPQGHPVDDMRAFELQVPKGQGAGALPPRYLYESIQYSSADKVSEREPPGSPSLLHLIAPMGEQPTFLSLTPGVPMYGESELPSALGFLHLGADESALWGAADPVSTQNPEGAEVTIVRLAANGTWSQPLGPTTDPSSGNPFTKFPNPAKTKEERENEVVTSIAPDHSGESAWVALTSRENANLESAAPALIARVSASGEVSRLTLPSAGGAGLGAADKIVCPAREDCWLSTRTGYLFHLSNGGAPGRAAGFDQAFPNLINSRPHDAGVVQVIPDQPPTEEQIHEPPQEASLAESVSAPLTLPVALLSRIRSKLIHGTTLELSFHLAARARVRLIARRHRRIVASTAMHTFAAGNRKLQLALNTKNWPTKLDLQTHALEALPTTSIRSAATTTVGTGFIVLPTTPPFNGSRSLP